VKVQELLTDASPITVTEDDQLALAWQAMLWGDIRHLPVVRGAVVVGVLSERDILKRYVEKGARAGGKEEVRASMKSPVLTIDKHDEVETALHKLIEQGVGCLPVLDGRQLLGIVTRRDLLRRGLDLEETQALHGEGRHQDLGGSIDSIMSRDPVTASEADHLIDVVERMDKLGIRHLPVIDGDRHVVGMLSDRDVRTAIGNSLRAIDVRDARVRIETILVGKVMTRNPMTILSGTRASRAASFFADHKVGAVPVTDEQNRIVGIVSYLDVLRAIVGRKLAQN
jgi:CBS domain-containing protein